MTGIEQEAQRVVDAAAAQNLHLRLIGGLAVRLLCPSANHRDLARTGGDLDFVGYYRESHKVSGLLTGLGYEPEKRFNALHGRHRLIFSHPAGKPDIDIFLDQFTMCHTLDLDDRLELGQYTLTATDLLLTKLQVVELNEKDVKDIYIILADHPATGEDAERGISLKRIGTLCGNDWGWYKTVALNLEHLARLTETHLTDPELIDHLNIELQTLRNHLEVTPKSLRWKLRARVGERVQWYELPEDLGQ